MEKKAENNKIHAGHRERVKKRFLNEGLDSFEDHQALELLLYYSIPQADTNGLAHRLINEFGSFDAVFDASVQELVRVKGVGLHTAALIKLIPAMYSKYLLSRQNASRIILDSGKAAGEYFAARFINLKQEALMAAFLDAKLEVKRCTVISQGDLSSTRVDLASLVTNAKESSAVNIIIAHNHPSGVAAPSPNDVDAVREIAIWLGKVGLRLCDSIIVAGNDYFSMADKDKFRYIF